MNETILGEKVSFFFLFTALNLNEVRGDEEDQHYCKSDEGAKTLQMQPFNTYYVLKIINLVCPLELSNYAIMVYMLFSTAG